MSTEKTPTTAPVDAVVITPQPKMGRPFQFRLGTKGVRPDDWWNENVGHRRSYGPMLFHWRCPFGINGKPALINGVWYWVKIVPDES